MNKSDSGSGESVNCYWLGADYNDIHIDIGPRAHVDPCEGIVVEMIPTVTDFRLAVMALASPIPMANYLA